MGDAFDPNRAGPAEIAHRVGDLLEGATRGRASALGELPRPGAELAWDLMEERAHVASRLGGASVEPDRAVPSEVVS